MSPPCPLRNGLDALVTRWEDKARPYAENSEEAAVLLRAADDVRKLLASTPASGSPKPQTIQERVLEALERLIREAQLEPVYSWSAANMGFLYAQHPGAFTSALVIRFDFQSLHFQLDPYRIPATALRARYAGHACSSHDPATVARALSAITTMLAEAAPAGPSGGAGRRRPPRSTRRPKR
jgi:hypothetical protein